MGAVWMGLIMLSVICALVLGYSGETAAALLRSGEEAVALLLTLLGTMTMWSGLMEVLEKAGDVRRLGKLLRRVGKPLFGEVEDEASWDAVSMNLSANLLGLGNAATPAGIEASKRLARQGKSGLEALAMLLALDNSAMQLIPTTVITLRAAAGAAEPADIWGATLISSTCATLAAILLMKLVNRRRKG